MLSGYRIMWIMVMFDLPAATKIERKYAIEFRNFLLDEGFEMSQFSIYMRHCPSREKADAIGKRVIKEVPQSGKVSIVLFTDKQFGEIVSYSNYRLESPQKNPSQYLLL